MSAGRVGWRVVGLCLAGLACPAWAAPVVVTLDPAQAVPASALLDTMGVNTHFSFADTPYAMRYAEVRAKLMALGLHHVRDLLTPRAADLARDGITTAILLEPNTTTPEAARARVKALNAVRPTVDAVEGANEPDMFWGRLGIAYRGQGYPAGPAAWQRDLFATFKADPATAKLPVIGLSLGLAGMADKVPPRALDGLRSFVDWGDVHPYPYGGNPSAPDVAYGGLASFYRQGSFPSVYIGECPDALRAYRSIYGSGPMAATETGYPTGRHFTAEALQARYVPRLFAEHFRLGYRRTYLYQLLDSVEDPTGRDPDASFGLLRHDLSPRPAYAALQRFALMLAKTIGPGAAVPRGLGLRLAVSGAGAFTDATRVHHLLLSRPDGTLLLLLWHEVSGEDVSTDPHRPIAVPPMPATLSVSEPAVMRVVDLDGHVATSPMQAGSTVDFAVPDAIVGVEIAGRKQSFFEKKDQKTFELLGPRQPDKSFLLLFFKKEGLPSS